MARIEVKKAEREGDLENVARSEYGEIPEVENSLSKKTIEMESRNGG